ncbi:MAG: selenium-dependent molybdenum cofactor biosynthesis protein YqeB [Eubacteriales bacterium]|nr:selenium-dependent molybdenum cofactor biosynthesis protein YqeB [Eubacteriales bacterium]
MEQLIVVRGGGDLASGVIHRLHQCGYRVLILEQERPTSIRRKVSFSEALFDGESSVEGVICRKISSLEECEPLFAKGVIPIMADPKASVLSEITPNAVIDAMIAKRNLGTNRSMAPLTIGLGPGFTAGEDVDFVVETMRGHNLGRIIRKGGALPNTGVPGAIAGVTKDRVIHSPGAGMIHNYKHISDVVEKGEILAMVGDTPVPASISGVLRGIIREGFDVPLGMKIADIDPRIEQKKNCFTISDKARCIAGGVLEILMNQGVRP